MVGPPFRRLRLGCAPIVTGDRNDRAQILLDPDLDVPAGVYLRDVLALTPPFLLWPLLDRFSLLHQHWEVGFGNAVQKPQRTHS